MTMVEAIYRGQNWRARMRGMEWKQGLLDALQTFGQNTPNTLSPFLGPIGDRWTKFAFPLVLTAILGNPPTTPQSLTATNAAPAPQMQAQFNMTSKVRELPLEMALIPYNAGAAGYVPFSTT